MEKFKSLNWSTHNNHSFQAWPGNSIASSSLLNVTTIECLGKYFDSSKAYKVLIELSFHSFITEIRLAGNQIHQLSYLP